MTKTNLESIDMLKVRYRVDDSWTIDTQEATTSLIDLLLHDCPHNKQKQKRDSCNVGTSEINYFNGGIVI